jgi:hypothetical protein
MSLHPRFATSLPQRPIILEHTIKTHRCVSLCTVTDAAHALLYAARAAAHGRLDARIIAICATRTVIVSDPNMLTYNRRFL